MKQPKDKRTKAYKDWKANQEKASEGLGDTIAKVTEATGIKKAVKFLAGEDCGCDERQERLNRIFMSILQIGLRAEETSSTANSSMK